MASTYTTTNTFTRKNCIKNQFKTAFLRLMDYSSKDYKDYIEAIECKKIDHINFYGYKYNKYNKKEKWIELTLFVEWDKYDEYIVKGEKSVQLKSKWGEVLPEVTVAIETIEEFVKEYNLKVNFSVGFVSNMTKQEKEQMMETLGLVYGEHIPWKNNSEICTIYSKRPREISELHTYIKSIYNPD